MSMRWCILLLVAVSLPLAAQTHGRQLRDFAAEAEAFNRGDPMANVFRAGYFAGYLNGVLDTLQGRSICFAACRCEVEKRVVAYLAEHPEAADRPVSGWLVPLLEATYPCR